MLVWEAVRNQTCIGFYLDEGGTSLVGRRCEASHVTDDPTSQCNKRGFAAQPGLESLVPDLLQDLESLVLLAIWKDHCLYLESSLLLEALHKAAHT